MRTRSRRFAATVIGLVLVTPGWAIALDGAGDRLASVTIECLEDAHFFPHGTTQLVSTAMANMVLQLLLALGVGVWLLVLRSRRRVAARLVAGLFAAVTSALGAVGSAFCVAVALLPFDGSPWWGEPEPWVLPVVWGGAAVAWVVSTTAITSVLCWPHDRVTTWPGS